MLLFLGALACDGGDTGSAPKGYDLPAGDAAAGGTVYTDNCSYCHGEDGKLGYEMGGVAASDLTVEVPEQSDDELATVSIEGYGEMPPILSADDLQGVADCIAYMRTVFP
jgi:mono/diheme cytochrome c family protein